MFEGFAQIGGVQDSHVGQDGLQLVQRQFDWGNGRWAVNRKWIGDAFKLGKGRVRFQYVEAGKAGLPIFEPAHDEKAWGRPDAKPAAATLSHVTPPALGPGRFLTGNRIPRHFQRDRNPFLSFWRGEDRRSLRGEPLDRATAHLRCQPVCKALCALSFAAHIKVPRRTQAREQRSPIRANDHFRGRGIIDYFDPNLGFQGKSRGNVFDQPALDQRTRGIECYPLVIGHCQTGQQGQDQHQHAHGASVRRSPARRQR